MLRPVARKRQIMEKMIFVRDDGEDDVRVMVFSQGKGFKRQGFL